MADFKNEFSWSVSRNALFSECKRKYYYNYYGSWGGWDKNIADKVIRELYVLKNLQMRWMWKGNIVHHEIERILKELVSTGALTPIEKSIERVTQLMREGFRSSREGRYWDHNGSLKDKLALFEHEYSEEISDETWKKNYDETILCIENFYSSDVLETVQSLNKEDVITIESMKPSSLSFSEERFFVKPDLAYKLGERLQIVDWKTGAGDADDFQFKAYTIYGIEELGFELGNIDVLEYNLVHNKKTVHNFSSQEIEDTKDIIIESINQMKSYLYDPKENLANMTDFERTDNSNTCNWCNFQKICFDLD